MSYTTLSLPGQVSSWGNAIAAGVWADDLAAGLDLDITGATLVADGGPGVGLPDALSFDGSDDHAEYSDPTEAQLNLGASGDGRFWIALWVQRTADGPNFDQVVGKGNSNCYMVRRSTGATRMLGEARGGTGGDVAVDADVATGIGTWRFIVVQQETDSDRLAVYSGGPLVTDAVALINSAPRSGTVGSNTDAKFVVGAQDNHGTIRRWFPGRIAGVRIGTGAALSLTQMQELFEASFVEPSGGDTITPDDATHAHTAESPTLVQGHVLEVHGTSHGHTAEAPTLSVAVELAVDGTQHAHTAEAPALVQSNLIAPAGATHGQTAESPALTQAHVLAPADASHSHTADSPTLSTALILAPDGARHAHTADAPALVQAHILSPDAARHAHRAGSPTLILAGILSVDSTRHAHTAELLTLSQAYQLIVQSARHGHTAESPVLSFGALLQVANALHGHRAESPELVQATILVVQGTRHAHWADVVQSGLTDARIIVLTSAGRSFIVTSEPRDFAVSSHRRNFHIGD